MTPTFGVMGIALALVALASVRVSQTEERASRRAWESTQERYRAEGVAAIAAWRILHEQGTPTLYWQEDVDGRRMSVLAEPEMRKLGLAEVGSLQGQLRLRALVGQVEADRLIATLGADTTESPSRHTVRNASNALAWRACGLSFVSTHSRLTDNALTRVQAPSTSDLTMRAGEVWRISVASDKRLILDRTVRFTGDAAHPLALLDQLRGGPVPDPSCAASFQLGVPS